jgi:cytochrome c556
MKKIMLFLSVAIFLLAVLAFAAEVKKPELRPAQILMQARQGWLKAMNKNLQDGNFPAIVKDADELAAQAKKVGDGLANPLAKDITLAISMFAREDSAAAAKKDADTVKIKLASIKGKCDECHAKIRDKKK